MATRSTISFISSDNKVKSIYCHNDGYLHGNGALLYQYYREPQLIKEMVDLGAMSYLEDNLKDSSFYHRDSKESLSVYKANSLNDLKNGGFLEEFNYVFKADDEKWYLLNKETNELEDLAILLLNNDEVSNEVKDMITAQKLYSKINKEIKEKSSTKGPIKKI